MLIVCSGHSSLPQQVYDGSGNLCERAFLTLVFSILIACESLLGCLVTWHKIQSPRLAFARIIAGRDLVCDRSEKGKRTSTMAPAAGRTTPRPPRAGSNPLRVPPR